jgi:hypothetical protein
VTREAPAGVEFLAGEYARLLGCHREVPFKDSDPASLAAGAPAAWELHAIREKDLLKGGPPRHIERRSERT